jgi:hypothetical protein
MAHILEGAVPNARKVLVRVEAFDAIECAMLSIGGLEPRQSHIIEIDRNNIPTDALRPHENHQNTPNIEDRRFEVLLSRNPQFGGVFPPMLKPTDSAKNVWGMREEFFELSESDWSRNLRDFLNRWGMWACEFGYTHSVMHGGPMPGFVVTFPQLLREKRDEYRKSLEPKSARKWLSTARPLSFSTLDKPPYFLVERFYCADAIEASITIDHLAGRQFGFCKRCARLFEHETRHRKNYCSRRCIQAAGVQRWREKQRKLAAMETKDDA